MSKQVEAHHYCMHYNQDMRQCAIFDSPKADVRLINVEYIISRSFSILYLMRRRNCGTPMSTKSKVGFSFNN
jgi:hypothetical protein